ncbi:DUF1761 domain-containing protein [Pedobacter yulinensis]|uniref:DUF1761 domain-containing protein n=1 Tax=Pedobacter yulinensis TaxID=2126353 RepID=A0A2T3HJL8_9SPHI|nr:DUF1761 domain-containing protein [Pedobacter yulinensis]PST82581.1 DUF1761 domain-containing protein [Pedobacter yulinensis]
MVTQLTHLNWAGIGLAFFAYFVLGALWFTVLFNKSYRVSLGRPGETLPNSPIFILGPAICSFLITLASAILMELLNISDYADALLFTGIVGIGFLFANTVNIAINPNMPRPLHYGMISGAYHLVGIGLANTILVAMQS